MWTYGEYDGYKYEAKVYGGGSPFGIGGGRVSKLWIYSQSGRVIACYDRGWDIRPDAELQYVIDGVVNLFDGAKL